MIRKTLCILLACMLVFGLAACDTGGDTPADSSTPAPATSTPAPAQTPAPADEAPVGLRWFMRTSGSNIGAQDRILEAANEITIAKSNTYIADLLLINNSAYMEQLNLMFASQEDYDIIMDGSFYLYPNHIAKGYLADIDEELNTYGQEILSVLGDFSNVVSSGGKLYGITTMRDLATARGLQFNKALLDKYDLDVSGIESSWDAEPLFAKVHAEEPDMVITHSFYSYSSAIVGIATNLHPTLAAMDTLASNNDGVALLDPANSTELSNIAASDAYREALLNVRDWYLKGYTLTDVSSSELQGQELLKAGRLFAINGTIKAGQDGQVYTATDVEVVDVITTSIYANTATATGGIFAFPASAGNDTKYAIQWMNVLYSDAELVNLLCYGFEGEHWVMHSDGQHITYPEGVDSQSTSWGLQMNWMMGDQFKSMIWEGTALDVWEKQAAMHDNAEKSLAMGVTFDTEAIKNEMASVANVRAEYAVALECGTADVDQLLPTFIQKLEAAGINTILEEKQSQLDAALAA
ncbi:ABC transporter substrate-binding protein [Oscillospiraceae bacterium OttesenSCG-928-F05]|nr:ABC transporter substrate-binding protein [Oscillospiraceae bacterium OttesenSCG-928-F05]